MNQVFDALKASLAGAVMQGLVAILVLCVMILLFSLLLKDVPFKPEESAQKEAVEVELPEAVASE